MITSFSLKKMEGVSFFTREFVPDFYEREIFNLYNGSSAFNEFPNLNFINLNVKGEHIGKRLKDIMCCLERKKNETSQIWKEFARSEVCWHTVNPEWIRPFTIGYNANNPNETLRLSIYSVVSNLRSLDSQKLIAKCDIRLNELLSKRKRSMIVDVISEKKGTKDGVLNISFYPINPKIFGSIVFRCSVENRKKTPLKKMKPYFTIKRYDTVTEEWILIYKSNKSKKCHWHHIELPLKLLDDDNLFKSIQSNDSNHQNEFTKILISFHDFSFRGQDKLIGYAETTTNLFLQSSGEIDIISTTNKKICTLSYQLIDKIQKPHFDDYKLKSVKVDPIIAIDFSSSRMSPIKTNKSPHIDVGILSYSHLIIELCDNLMKICSNSPLSGYGMANFKGNKLIPLQYNSTFKFSSIKTFMTAYSQLRNKTSFPNEASLLPIIKKIRSEASQKWEREKVISLGIVLCNGIFCDLQDSIDELIDAEDEPICFVIILIGGSRKEIESAFAENAPLENSSGKVAKRPIATLINYEKNCIHSDLSLDAKINPAIRHMIVKFLEGSNFDPFST